MIGRKACASWSWPVAWTANIRSLPYRVPVGRLTFACDTARRERVRVDLHAHRVFLLSEHLHLRHAVDGGDALGEIGLGVFVDRRERQRAGGRSEEHTSELQSRFGISYAVFCLKK